MSTKPTIAIVGATGTQGGSLARAILNDPSSPFAARILTRNPNSPVACELEKLGAEVVAGDIDDEASVQQLFDGAYGAYCVTFFWNHFSPEKELAEARTMANAAKSAGVQHVIWSTLEDTRNWIPLNDNHMPTLMGHYKVPHFDAKGEANRFFTESGVPTTFFHTSFYWDNLINLGMGPIRESDGKLVLTLPLGDKKLAGIAGEDIGQCAYGIFKGGLQYVGQTIGVAGQHMSGKEMADALGTALVEEVLYRPLSLEDYRGLGFPGSDDLGNMFQCYQEFEREFLGARDIAFSRHINPELQTFEQWLVRNKDRIPTQ